MSPALLLAAPFVMIACVWLYTMIFTFSALWFTHYGLSALETLRLAEARMQAARAVGALPQADAVPSAGPPAPPREEPHL